MTAKLFALNNWIYAHRAQIQLVLVVVVVGIALVSLLAPGTITFADDIGSGH
ncbi:MAG TPA: hypothetical protein VKQ72_08875 [Aggregatilineales bacterium]|nr:hypothetical protein [Aggregatilineales bacterium]